MVVPWQLAAGFVGLAGHRILSVFRVRRGEIAHPTVVRGGPGEATPGTPTPEKKNPFSEGGGLPEPAYRTSNLPPSLKDADHRATPTRTARRVSLDPPWIPRDTLTWFTGVPGNLAHTRTRKRKHRILIHALRAIFVLPLKSPTLLLRGRSNAVQSRVGPGPPRITPPAPLSTRPTHETPPPIAIRGLAHSASVASMLGEQCRSSRARSEAGSLRTLELWVSAASSGM